MSFNKFGKLFRFTTWGESHGPAIGCVVDGCPPRIKISEKDIQKELNKRKPGQSKFTTQRKEDDKVEILSGVFNGETTGTPILMIIYNKDMKSRDYETLLFYFHMLLNYNIHQLLCQKPEQHYRKSLFVLKDFSNENTLTP